LSKIKAYNIASTIILALCIWGPPQLRLRSGYDTIELANQLAFDSSFDFDFANIFRIVVWSFASILAIYCLINNSIIFKKLILKNPVKWYFCFGILALISASYSPSFLYTIFFSSQIIVLLIISLYYVFNNSTYKYINVLFYVFIIQWVVIVLLYLVEPDLVGRSDRAIGFRLVGGLFGDFGTAALISNVFFITNIFHNRYLKKFKKYFFYTLYLFSWVFIYLTFTRSVIISGVIILLLNIIIYRNTTKKIIYNYILLFSFIIIFVSGIHISVLEQLSRGQTLETIKTLSARTVLFSYLLDRWIESPFIGFGYGAGARWLLADLVREGLPLGSAHNAFIKVIVELGIIGTIVLLVSFFKSWSASFKLKKIITKNSKYRLLFVQILSLMIFISIGSLFGDGIAGGSSTYIVVIILITYLLTFQIRNKK
jgi:hypothetical protein